MRILFRCLLLAVIVAVGIWAWTFFFPNPRVVIHHRLDKLAQLASSSGGDGNLRNLASVEAMGSYFSEDAQVILNIPGLESHTIEGRAELMQVAMGFKGSGRSLKAELVGQNIELNPGNPSAIVDATLKAKIGGESDFIVQELKFNLKVIDGKWLITRIETIKTLK